MSESLIPISDEQAKLGQEALKTLQGLGSFLRDTFGTIPEDIVGLLGGDYLKVKRAENLYRAFEKAKQRLDDEGVQKPDASPSLAIPIMIAAADESRDELQEIWASLLAAAANPVTSKLFRVKFIEIAKRLDPLDPVVLSQLSKAGTADYTKLSKISGALGLSDDLVSVSLANLENLELARRVSSTEESQNFRYLNITPLGRELLRAIDLDRAKQ